ncbi:MAG: hypothetical protein ACFBSF_07925 [Leptolyngbyaceae cyanobacterium]
MNRRSGHRRWTRSRIRQRWSTRGALTPPTSGQDWQAFDTDLQQLEADVQSLRQRFEGIQNRQRQQQQLRQQLQDSGLSADEVKRLKRQLDELEVQLESDLFNWRSLLEPFWQAVRFGGLGIILGWVLKGIVDN